MYAHQYQCPVFSSPSPFLTLLNVAVYFDALAALLSNSNSFNRTAKVGSGGTKRGLKGCAIWEGYSSTPYATPPSSESLVTVPSGNI